MKNVIIDTNILIDYLRAGRGPFSSLTQLQKQHKIELCLSSITVMELFAGESSRQKSEYLKEFIDQFKIIPFDKNIAKFCGELRRDQKMAIQTADLLIGATTLWLKAQLATRNQKHFTAIPGLKFFNLPTSGEESP